MYWDVEEKGTGEGAKAWAAQASRWLLQEGGSGLKSSDAHWQQQLVVSGAQLH